MDDPHHRYPESPELHSFATEQNHQIDLKPEGDG